MFFDVGETLVHPRPSFPELFARIVDAAGHARDPDAVLAASAAVRRGFSEASRGGRRWTLTAEDSRAFWLDVYDQMLEELGMARVDGLRETLYEGFTDLGNYELFDDVPATLDELEGLGGLVPGIVSNFEAWLDDLLRALGVRDRFPVRVISGLEGVEKPDPRIYRLALERAGVDARRCGLRRRQPGVRRGPARRARHVPRADRPPRAIPRPRRGPHHRSGRSRRRPGGGMSERLFDVAAADALLPMLRELLPRVRERRARR